MVRLTMSFDMRAPDFGAEPVRLYQAALDQCEWADKLGFSTVTFMEHHASSDGYLPAPIVMAAAAAGRTRNIEIELALMLLTLHDPLRAAEELAVLDLAANGRLRLVVGAGYRPEEFEQFGLDMKKRPSLMERGIDTLKQAWTGEPFEYEGRTVRILPRPAQRPRPQILMGASSRPAAERAGRIADGLRAGPGLEKVFAETARALGRPVPEPRPSPPPYFLLYVARDPDAAWQKIGPHALHVNNEYGKWLSSAENPAFRPVANIEALKGVGMCRVVTPEECVEMAKTHGELYLQPLFGGMDPDLAWESLRLVEHEVLPKL